MEPSAWEIVWCSSSIAKNKEFVEKHRSGERAKNAK
jgi:hypothetical protein